MPRSRKRHHSRSKSRSRSPSRDRSRERDDKHKKVDSHEKDRDGKRRKIESYDSPHHKRSVSSESNNPSPEEQPITEVSTDKISKVDKNVGELENTIDKETETMELSDENETNNESTEISKNESSLALDDSDDKIKPSQQGSTSTSKSTLEVTPKKGSVSKKLQKKLESAKKRQERQKEKEEKERVKNEERERIKQEKLKKKEEKQKEFELKQKEKELKEEQRKKEREEKEEIKKKEREEKEQKRKEKEERDEQKRKEIEEKNKEKQREDEKKQKAAAAFVNFFVPKKNENCNEEKKLYATEPSAFMAFEVKSDMKLPPTRRKPLSDEEKEALSNCIKNQSESMSYLKDLKSGKAVGKSAKTWPFEETVDDEVTVVEDENNFGETVSEDNSKAQKLRAKFFKFHENRRPPYFGTWRKRSQFITSRRPFAEDKDTFNYSEDSDDDWEEEEQGESLNGSDDEADKENDDEKDDYEVDNEFFVPHGHLSDDEIDDEETARMSPNSMKQKLKLLKDEFDQDMQSKTHKLKPRYIGCIWYNKNGTNVEEAINRYLQPLAIISNGQIQIKNRSEISTFTNIKKNTIELNPEYVPMFLKIIHGNSSNKRVLVEQFMTYLANNDITVDIKKTTLIKNLKNFATWRKCKENGPMRNKLCWLVKEDIEKKYNMDLELPNTLESDKK